MDRTISNKPGGSSYSAPPPNVPLPLALSAFTIAARRLGTSPEKTIKPEGLQHDQVYMQTLTPPGDIVSPTVVAAMDYYLSLNYQLDTPPYSGAEEEEALQMRIHPALRNVVQESTIPRRHSAALEPYPGSRIADIKAEGIQLPRRGSSSSPQNTGKNEHHVMDDVDQEWWKQKVKDESFNDPGVLPSAYASQPVTCMQDIIQEAAVPEQQIHNPLDPRLLGNIPFSYTTNKLRGWGSVYLFNSSTADAFVRAIPIQSAQPKPRHTHVSPDDLHRALSDFTISTKRIKKEEDDDDEPNTISQLVKVKIIPQLRTNRPFYMQKHFPIRKSSSSRIIKHVASPRHHIRHQEENCRGTKVEVLQDVAKVEMQAKRPAVPIHIEYALHRAPLLAAILLSEHVKRGATIEIPLLFPEVWEDAVEWMYIGSAASNVDPKVRETIEYLGGTI